MTGRPGPYAVWLRWLPSSRLLGQLTTALLVILAFGLFRSASLGDAGSLYASLVGLHGITGGADVTPGFAAGVAVLLALVLSGPEAWHVALRWRLRPVLGVAVGVTAALAVLTLGNPSPFLYFQF